MTAKIVEIREGAPLLTDIPGMLRRQADRIEAGELGEVDVAFLVLPIAGAYPRVFGWGDIEGKNDPAIQLELARMWLLANMVERA